MENTPRRHFCFRCGEQGEAPPGGETADDDIIRQCTHDSVAPDDGIVPVFPLLLRKVFRRRAVALQSDAIYGESVVSEVLREGAHLQGSSHVPVGKHDTAPDTPGTHEEGTAHFGGLAVPGLIKTGVNLFEFLQILAQ